MWNFGEWQRCQRIIRNDAGSFVCTSAWVCVCWWEEEVGGREAEKESQNFKFM